MFNLHKHADLVPLAGLRKDKIFKEMEEGIFSSPIIETYSSEQGEVAGRQVDQDLRSIDTNSDSDSDREHFDHAHLPDQLRKPKP